MGNNSNCEKNGSEDLFSTKFIRNWWYVAMGIILAFLIMQCCFTNELCMSKIPPYIGYIVLILLILYPLFNSISIFGIKLKKAINHLEGMLYQDITLRKKKSVKIYYIRNKYKNNIKLKNINFQKAENIVNEAIQMEKDKSLTIDPLMIRDTIVYKLIDVANAYFEDYPFEEIDPADIANEITDDLSTINLITQEEEETLTEIVEICNVCLVSNDISEENEAKLRSIVKKGFEIIERL